jgi:hypothetical protein
MRRQCPNCKSLNVRRSSREPEDLNQPFYRSPYRCRDCRTKFWAFSAKLYRRIVVVGVVVGIMLVLMLAMIISAEFGAPSFGMEPILARVAVNLPLRRPSGGGVSSTIWGYRPLSAQIYPGTYPPYQAG